MVGAVDRWLYLVQFKDGYYSYLSEEPQMQYLELGSRVFHLKMGVRYSEVLKFMEMKMPKSTKIREITRG